jgi:hypothetical protein
MVLLKDFGMWFLQISKYDNSSYLRDLVMTLLLKILLKILRFLRIEIQSPAQEVVKAL